MRSDHLPPLFVRAGDPIVLRNVSYAQLNATILAATNKMRIVQLLFVISEMLAAIYRYRRAACLLQNLHSGAKVEMIGVGQDYLCLGLVFDVAVEDTLHRGCRAHGHKNRGFNGAVVGLQEARARLTLGRSMLQCKLHNNIYNVQIYSKNIDYLQFCDTYTFNFYYRWSSIDIFHFFAYLCAIIDFYKP